MLLFALIAGLLFSASSHAQDADLLLEHGKIVTVDGKFRVVDSMAVKGGRIVAAGSRAEAAKFAGPATRRIDLKGKTVLPGLIDSHTHAADASMYEFDHPVPDMESVADVLAYIRQRAAAAKPGDWIMLRQVFITRLRDQRFPTRAELDEAAPRNPVYFGTGPDASVNSLALKLSGIDRNFRITDGLPGRIERDAGGEPTGILRSCGRLIKAAPTGRRPTAEDRRQRI
jgi:predicted amidohydrolase YtcJ